MKTARSLVMGPATCEDITADDQRRLLEMKALPRAEEIRFQKTSNSSFIERIFPLDSRWRLNIRSFEAPLSYGGYPLLRVMIESDVDARSSDADASHISNVLFANTKEWLFLLREAKKGQNPFLGVPAEKAGAEDGVADHERQLALHRKHGGLSYRWRRSLDFSAHTTLCRGLRMIERTQPCEPSS